MTFDVIFLTSHGGHSIRVFTEGTSAYLAIYRIQSAAAYNTKNDKNLFHFSSRSAVPSKVNIKEDKFVYIESWLSAGLPRARLPRARLHHRHRRRDQVTLALSHWGAYGKRALQTARGAEPVNAMSAQERAIE